MSPPSLRNLHVTNEKEKEIDWSKLNNVACDAVFISQDIFRKDFS